MNPQEQQMLQEFPGCIYLNAEQFKGALVLYQMLLKQRVNCGLFITKTGSAMCNQIPCCKEFIRIDKRAKQTI